MGAFGFREFWNPLLARLETATRDREINVLFIIIQIIANLKASSSGFLLSHFAPAVFPRIYIGAVRMQRFCLRVPDLSLYGREMITTRIAALRKPLRR